MEIELSKIQQELLFLHKKVDIIADHLYRNDDIKDGELLIQINMVKKIIMQQSIVIGKIQKKVM